MIGLRAAAQQALEALRLYKVCYGTSPAEEATLTALRAALAEPVQEPVAWRFRETESKPWSLSDDGYYISCKRDQRYFVEALYTAPPQRKPLTEEEIEMAYREIWRALPTDFEHTSSGWIEQGIKYAERAHGIGGQDEP